MADALKEFPQFGQVYTVTLECQTTMAKSMPISSMIQTIIPIGHETGVSRIAMRAVMMI
jgi:hypothetical protein